MATILLSAAGAAIGGGFGGTILGLSGAVIGRAVGATLGRVIDQRLLGGGSQRVETGKVDRFRLASASEGDAVGVLWGRMRIAGQVIWATRFLETTSTTTQKTGKGSSRSSTVTTTSHSYSVSLAMALCEGQILRVGRVWADGLEVDASSLNMRVYDGSESQLPDPKIEAVEGAGLAPAYRGIAYVVIEDLALEPYGNRVPQFTFEVVRAAQGDLIGDVPDLTHGLEAVALIPGTGEYALATEPVYYAIGAGLLSSTSVANQNAPGGKTDFSTALETLNEELPNCGAVSLVVSWFGDDLRCAACQIKPKVDQISGESTNMPWKVSGLERGAAERVPLLEGSAVYGGTPADRAVIEAIQAMRAAGKAVTFYPFILMEQLAGNGRPDPWSDAADQAVLPWRGRITLSEAPGRSGSPDQTAAATAEVAAFFGAAQPGHFAQAGDTIAYSGPAEWSMRRFILHYAHLCAMAGGVDAFCIGTEMVALTHIRSENHSFPAVAQFRQLAGEVKTILGAGCKVGYAADWSEYFGYQSPDGNRYFHLDPLWADANIDFVGIDNYMPLSDWRDGEEHADADWLSIYNLDYLQSNIEGGEGYDWYYNAPEHRAAQIRTPIGDGEYGEPWVWRYKDIRNWWANPHHERMSGVRSETSTDWVPQSKPIWFTELGCAAVDKGTNQPNKFLDPKSSESSLPFYSDGRRDELIQMQYLRAMVDYWADGTKNPVSGIYGGRMLDMSRAHVWAWDSRPYPQFPANDTLWKDAENYARGHWISGRATAQPLASVVAEICERSGLFDIDVSELYGLVRGYAVSSGQSGRASIQSLMLAYGFEALERDGTLVFRMREGRRDADLAMEELALGEDDLSFETARAPEAEMAGRVRLTYIEADGDFETRAVEALFPDDRAGAAAASELALSMTRAEAQGVVERWLAEARVSRDTARFALPPSRSYLGPGDVVAVTTDEGTRRYRIDRMEQAGTLNVEAVRIEPGAYISADEAEELAVLKPFAAPVPMKPVFLDLPLLSGQEDPYAPHLAVTGTPWPGTVAVYSSIEDAGYELNTLIRAQSVMGETLSPMWAVRSGIWDRGPAVRVQLANGALESAAQARVLNGANLMAIGTPGTDQWELFQFAEAEPVAAGIWDLSLRLRGQLGTDALMPEVWPEGSAVVLLDGTPTQIALPASARGLSRHYRIGSALRGYDDPSYVHEIAAFSGNGLRPLSPCHLKMVETATGWTFGWVRRTRIDGDSWDGYDVPLGEGQELYLVRVLEGNSVRREAVVSNPWWSYSRVEKLVDGISGDFAISVAQISQEYGSGLFETLSVLA